jgi:DNA-binding LacI/PurR family transcriptional regulator
LILKAAHIRQRDIAERAQVSQTAVSLVLNGKGRQYGISRATEERIRQTISDLGYAPNVTAQALRGGRNGLIGVHTFDPLFPTGPDHYYYEFMIGIEQQATAAGQDLVLITSVHQDGADRSIWREGSNRLRIADGAVILGFHEQDSELEELARQRFPFVFIGRRRRAAKLMPYVAPDYADGVRRVVELINRRGHRRAAYFGVPNRTLPRDERLAAFTKACRHAGIAADRRLTEPRDVTADQLRSLLDDQVTVVITESNRLVEALGRACTAAGIDIPGELSVVSLDSLSNEPSRSWTHLQTPRRLLGSRAVEILLGLLTGDHRRDFHDVLSCPLEAGATLSRPGIS